ncbi:alpha/beta hydrolase [Hahella ganghwensis]|uniref:alpha/beta hydrolase n=1 Tax=Hahella ganghwensis TaxID=286420 RepID=UPI00037AE6F9|nr:alpha/beta hydrolase [Hahella ganghwensis]
MRRPSRLKRTALVLLLLAASGGVVSSWIAGTVLTAPARTTIANPPDDFAVESIVYGQVHGWFSPVTGASSCALLMHGIRSNRSAMIDRARFLRNQGYSVFLIDLQAHGESPGSEITFGFREAQSASDALKFLRIIQGCEKVVSLGYSLGGAASLLGRKPLEVDAFILEAVYPSIQSAVYHRLEMRMGPVANLLAPLLYLQIPLRLDIPLASLQPIHAVQQIKAPVLIIAGMKDQHTPLAESRRLYEAVAAPKQFWAVEGAVHTDFYRYAPTHYRQKVGDFLSTHLE